MTTDTQSGAGAYKSDRADTAEMFATDATAGTNETGRRAPRRIHLGRDRHLTLDGRGAALAAGALGLGVLAFRAVSALVARQERKSAVAIGELEGAPRAERAEPAKDNAAPRFAGEGLNAGSPAPFVAASTADDTADLLVEVTEVSVVAVAAEPADRSALTPEHVPTDLMADRAPGVGDRAIDAFRPDPTAPVPPEMRDSLRPATGPAPSLSGDRGDFSQGLSRSDGAA